MQTSILRNVLTTFSSIIKNDKIRPITDLIEISSNNGVMSLGATDNRTTILAKIESNDVLPCVVLNLSTLYNLVKLTTTEEIYFKYKDKYVEFKGNGKQKLIIQQDELGRELHLTLKIPKIENANSVSIAGFQKAIARNKISVFTGDDHDEFKLYHIKDNQVITTNSIILGCTQNIDIGTVDIPSFAMEQLAVFNEDMSIEFQSNGIRVASSYYDMFIRYQIEKPFPDDLVSSLLTTDIYSYSFSVPQQDFIAAIKRQNTMKVTYESPSVVLYGTILINKQETSEEELAQQVNNPISVRLDTVFLLSILRCMNETIKVYISEKAIRLEDKQGFYVLAVKEG